VHIYGHKGGSGLGLCYVPRWCSFDCAIQHPACARCLSAKSAQCMLLSCGVEACIKAPGSVWMWGLEDGNQTKTACYCQAIDTLPELVLFLLLPLVFLTLVLLLPEVTLRLNWLLLLPMESRPTLLVRGQPITVISPKTPSLPRSCFAFGYRAGAGTVKRSEQMASTPQHCRWRRHR
jgi:hypothetical protein